jgi:hypothetical protein
LKPVFLVRKIPERVEDCPPLSLSIIITRAKSTEETQALNMQKPMLLLMSKNASLFGLL